MNQKNQMSILLLIFCAYISSCEKTETKLVQTQPEILVPEKIGDADIEKIQAACAPHFVTTNNDTSIPFSGSFWDYKLESIEVYSEVIQRSLIPSDSRKNLPLDFRKNVVMDHQVLSVGLDGAAQKSETRCHFSTLELPINPENFAASGFIASTLRGNNLIQTLRNLSFSYALEFGPHKSEASASISLNSRDCTDKKLRDACFLSKNYQNLKDDYLFQLDSADSFGKGQHGLFRLDEDRVLLVIKHQGEREKYVAGHAYDLSEKASLVLGLIYKK